MTSTLAALGGIRSAVSHPVITGWSAVSPFGIGRTAFVDGLHAGAVEPTQVDNEGDVCLVPAFDVTEVLGRKGTRSFNRMTGLAVSAIGELLGDPVGRSATAQCSDVGLVLGTSTGSAQNMMDFTRRSMTASRPNMVDPAHVPMIILNCAAAAGAIWHHLTGPNTTLAGGRVSGHLTLNYAGKLLAAGRAGGVLCGGVEEYSTARYWLERHSRNDSTLGEGAAMLLVEPAWPGADDRPPLAEVLAVHTAVFAGTDFAPALRTCVSRVLERAGVAPAELWACALGGDDFAGDLERQVVTERLDADRYGTRVVSVADLIGDTGAVTATFGVITLLGLAERDPSAAGRVAVVTSVDRDGVVGATLLRLHGANR